MVYYKIPLGVGGFDYPDGSLLCCAYEYNGYMYCKFEYVSVVGTGWASITEAEFNVRRPEFPEPSHNGIIESQEHTGCRYRIVDGEMEWINPPMMPDVEYRTAERYNGHPVYVKRIPFSDASVGENKAEKEAFKYGYTLVSCVGVSLDELYADTLPSFDTAGNLMDWVRINSTSSNLMPEMFPNVFAEVYSHRTTDFSRFEVTVKYIKA